MERKMKDSGIPWIGMIPKDWTVEPIGRNVLEVDNPNVGGVETNALQFKAGTIISKSKGDSKYHPETLEAYNIVDKGVIMLNGLNLSFDLISQRVGLVLERGVITSAYLAIKPNHNINSEYLTYLFKGYDSRKALHSMGKGLRQTLSYKELKQYLVVYPPLPTQQHIADFLDRKCAEIDELAALQETMIAELKRYKQSVITEAVTKGLNKNAPMKDSGVEWIGEIPEHWDSRRIKNIGHSQNGLTYSPADMVSEKEGILVLRSSNIQGGKLTFDDNVYVSTLIPPSLMVKKGDLIICSRNGSAALVGKCALVEDDNLKATYGAFMMRFQSAFYGRYIYYLLSSAISQYKQLFFTTTINQLTVGTFGGLRMPFTKSDTEQRAIADYLDRKCAEIDELIAIKQQKIEALKEYKKSVIFEYVTGKKEVEL